MICNVENLRHFRPNVRNKGDSSRAILTLQLQSLRRGNHGHHRPRTRIPLRCCACDSSSQSSAVTICYYLLHTYIHCHLSPGITSGYRHDLSAKSSHVSDAIRALFYIEKSHYIHRRTLSFNISTNFPRPTGIRIHCICSVCSPSEMFVSSSQNFPVLIIIVYRLWGHKTWVKEPNVRPNLIVFLYFQTTFDIRLGL